MEDEPINLIGCDTIVNSPSFSLLSIGMSGDHVSYYLSQILITTRYI